MESIFPLQIIGYWNRQIIMNIQLDFSIKDESDDLFRIHINFVSWYP